MLTLYILTFIIIILSVIYFRLQTKYNYWQKRNVKHLKPTLVFGSYKDFFLQKKKDGLVLHDLCKKNPNEPYLAAYFGTEPVLIVQDPELIKVILAKDFYYFNSREISNYAHGEHVNTILFFTFGETWKVLRQNFTQLFSPSKMKNMFPLIEKCSQQFENVLDELMSKSEAIESKSVTARFTIDVIGSCIFGIEMNAQTDDPHKNAFIQIGNVIFESSIVRQLAMSLRSAWPGFFYGIGLRALPKFVSDLFFKIVTGMFESRNNKPTSRNDIIDLLLAFKENKVITADNYRQLGGGKITLEMNDELLVAQCMIFFAAGYETSATSLSFTLYELAKSDECQEKALKEVDDYMLRHNNKLDYECIHELPYLEACVKEAMRLYPALSNLTREVMDDYVMPSGLHVEKGLRVHIPVYHIHHNAEYFPDPEEFRPNRFLEDKDRIKPYTYMPFGEGPRLCLGARFSWMQIMSGLITVLKKYRVTLADGMPKQVKLDPRSFVTQAKGGVRLKLIPRQGWEKRQYARA